MELYYVMSVVERAKADALLNIHEEMNLTTVLENLGHGTATSEHLLLYDLEETEKAVVSAIASKKTMQRLMYVAKQRLFIDIPGNGVMIAVPVKSVSGGKTLAFFTAGQDLESEGDHMHFDNELIVIILNEGYADEVMDAARLAGATGGTVLHAKGTGKARKEKFHGVSIAEEKDLIYILAPSEKKSAIMQAVNRSCGIQTPACAVSFSVPVTEVAGLRQFEPMPTADQ